MTKKPKAKDNILSRDERKRFIEAVESDEEELAIKGLLYTGMRVSELIHMQSSWINWDDGIIHIPYRIPCKCSQTCINPRYRYYKRNPRTKERVKLDKPEMTKPSNTWQVKTKHAERPIPILPEVKELFRIYFEDYDSIMELLDNRIKMWKLIKVVGERAGIGHKVFPHCLRATVATVFVERGLEDPVALTQIMGWADIKMAMVYIRLSGTSLKKKIDKIWNVSGD